MEDPGDAGVKPIQYVGPFDPKKQLECIPLAKSDTIWVNTDPVYERWRWDRSSPVLWITGPPGCGKSVLARHLVEGELQPVPGAILCYHYFPSTPTRKRKQKEALEETSVHPSTNLLDDESVLYQILQAEAGPSFDPPLTGYTSESLISLLSRTASDTASRDRVPVTCVLDGLDQITRSEDEFKRVGKLLDRMVHGDHGYDFKMLITCRPTLPTLEARFPKALFIRLENHMPQFDVCVRRYVKTRITELKRDNNLPDDIGKEDSVLNELDGSFLVAEEIVTTGLTSLGTVQVIGEPSEGVAKFPESLKDRYSSVLDHVDDGDLFMALLKTLAVASRALMPEELVDAVCSDGEKVKLARYLLRTRCEGLIAKDGDTRGLTVVHGFRVHDFVKNYTTAHKSSDKVLHRRMAELCMDRISSRVLNDEQEEGAPLPPEGAALEPGWLGARPFLGYAAANWPYHVTQAGRIKDSSFTERILDFCSPTSPQFMGWFPLYCRAANPPSPLTLGSVADLTDLMVASHFDLRFAIDAIWRQTPIDSDDGFRKARKIDHIAGQTALHIAAARGNMSATSSIISPLRLHHRGGEILNKRDYRGRTPLHCAIENGHDAAVDLLGNLDSIDINAQGQDLQTPLHYAVLKGHTESVKRLLGQNVVVDVKDRSNMTPRMYAKQLVDELETTGRVYKYTEEHATYLRRVDLLKMIVKKEGTALSSYPLRQHEIVNRHFRIKAIEFHQDTAFRWRRWKVHDVLTGLKSSWLRRDNQSYLGWLHLPANNMVWVEILLKQFEPDQFKIGTRDRILRKEAWANSLHRGSEDYFHAIFMEPQCQVVSVVDRAKHWGAGYTGDTKKQAFSLSLYMPFINWERLNKLMEISNFIERVKRRELSSREVDNLDSKKKKDELLLYHYLRPPNPLHNRRTLDQYRYRNLEDTRHRDQDQLLCRVNPNPDPPMLMVDQLWLWKLPNGKIITSFPSKWSSSDSDDNASDVLANTKLGLDEVRTSEDLIRLIVSECLLVCFDTKRHPQNIPNVLETYDNEIGRITDTEARLFRVFSQSVKTLTSNTPRQEAVDIVDPMIEIGLLREVKDIADELTTMHDIFRTQSSLIRDCSKTIKDTFATSEDWDDERSARFDRGWEELQRVVDTQLLAESETMAYQAKGVAQQRFRVTDLIMSSDILVERPHRPETEILEARWARTMAEETTRQGTTLMVFTIVTIIFLPLSFMAAFFALNIAQFPKTDAGLELGFVSKYIFSMSAAVVVPLLLIAFNVTRVAQFNHMIKTTILNKTELTSKVQGERPESPVTESSTKTKPPKDSMTQRLTKLQAADGDDKNKPSLPPSTLLLYIFVIFPITEVRFAGMVLLNIAGKRQPTGTVGPKPPHDSGEGVTEGEVDVITNGKWRLKPGIKRFLSGVIGGFRICFVPLWLSILCVEFLIGGVVYGLLSIMLVVNPLKAKVGELRRSTLLSLHDKVE